jgi:hypothetical protein
VGFVNVVPGIQLDVGRAPLLSPWVMSGLRRTESPEEGHFVPLRRVARAPGHEVVRWAAVSFLSACSVSRRGTKWRFCGQDSDTGARDPLG